MMTRFAQEKADGFSLKEWYSHAPQAHSLTAGNKQRTDVAERPTYLLNHPPAVFLVLRKVAIS